MLCQWWATWAGYIFVLPSSCIKTECEVKSPLLSTCSIMNIKDRICQLPVDSLFFYLGPPWSYGWFMNPYSYVFQFLHQLWRRSWRSLRGFPQTGSVFQTSAKPSCRQRSHTLMGVWPVPSKTPQILAGTEESYSGTELPLCHSLKSKACGSGRSKKKSLSLIL